jgi:branched-chain amino acid transport system ATP-binding protein
VIEPVVLRVQGLRKSFGGVEAVAGVSLGLARGEIRALIGPNGAGKSTLFNILAGQLRADAGTVELEGRPITGLAPHVIARRGVGRTFQITATFASLTALENVQVARLSYRRRSAVPWPPASGLEVEPARALLAEVGLAEHAGRPAAVLAYGDLKKLELAIALAGEPRLLLLDEPTAGMAAGERGALMALTASIARDRGLTVLFTEHDMDVVFAVADRILVLHEGRVIAEGIPAVVREDRQVQAVYLGEDA